MFNFAKARARPKRWAVAKDGQSPGQYSGPAEAQARIRAQGLAKARPEPGPETVWLDRPCGNICGRRCAVYRAAAGGAGPVSTEFPPANSVDLALTPSTWEPFRASLGLLPYTGAGVCRRTFGVSTKFPGTNSVDLALIPSTWEPFRTPCRGPPYLGTEASRRNFALSMKFPGPNSVDRRAVPSTGPAATEHQPPDHREKSRL